jgi:hypothetical protein
VTMSLRPAPDRSSTPPLRWNAFSLQRSAGRGAAHRPTRDWLTSSSPRPSPPSRTEAREWHPRSGSPNSPWRCGTRLLAFGFIGILLAGCAQLGPANPRDLEPLLRSGGAALRQAVDRAPELRLQVLIAELDESPGRPTTLRRHGFRVDAEYFYPASSIKLCAAVAALQEVERLEAALPGTQLAEAPLEIAPLFAGDVAQIHDPTHLAGGRITVAHEVRKLALVSDNQAFNRLYDFVGHEPLNRAMHALGLPSAVINHRLSDPRAAPDQHASAAVTLRPPGGAPVEVPARISPLRLTNTAPGLRVGQAFLRSDQRVDESMDFAGRNGITLVDLQNLLVKVVRPDVALPGAPLRLTPEHRALLVGALTGYPRESADPRYPAADYPDDYCKFLLPGVRRVFPATEPGRRVEITGKIGRAYGFTVENCALRNPATGRTVFVTAVLYTNADGVLNDDRYEYAEVADPVLADLGELVARRWLAPAGEAR